MKFSGVFHLQAFKIYILNSLKPLRPVLEYADKVFTYIFISQQLSSGLHMAFKCILPMPGAG